MPMASVPSQTWKLALMIGLPVAVPFAIAATVSGGPLVGLGTFAGLFAFTTAILAGVTLAYATIMTRGGARSPEGVVTGEYADHFDVGGGAETAFERAKAAVAGLGGAKILTADPTTGRIEAETSIGPYVQDVLVRVEGTTVHALAKHRPGRKLFDFGAGGKQIADLRRALEETSLPTTQSDAAREVGDAVRAGTGAPEPAAAPPGRRGRDAERVG